jgi:hypothetical protein
VKVVVARGKTGRDAHARLDYPVATEHTVPEAKPDSESTLVEQWLQDQQQWQRTLLAYLDSMVKNDDFLVHLGNAMRGSLLAGKPYPTASAATAPAATAPADDRLDQVLFALNKLQGQLNDLVMSLEQINSGLSRLQSSPRPASPPAPASPKSGKQVSSPRPSAKRKSRVRG